MNAHNEQQDPESAVVKQNLTTQPAAAPGIDQAIAAVESIQQYMRDDFQALPPEVFSLPQKAQRALVTLRGLADAPMRVHPRDAKEAVDYVVAHMLADSPKGGSDASWDDCKVAFGFDGDEDAIFDAWKRGQLSLPSGWSLNETDVAGARMVAVFRVDGVPAPKDGETVRELLNTLARAQAGDAEVRTTSGEVGP